MDKNFVDRLTEALALLCIAAAVVILVSSSRVSPIEGSLAGLTAQAVSDQEMAQFQELLGEGRRLVDTNRDPAPVLDRLKERFPGRHEVWALAARYAESRNVKGEALTAYARAVRLQPDYLDENSGLFLGKRIEALTARMMEELAEAKKDRGLDGTGKELLKTAYFLKRRLAGGCE